MTTTQVSSGASVSPDRIFQIATAGWACGILGASLHHNLFSLLESGPQTASSIAEKAGISQRGAQALLDGVVGLGFANVRDGKYENAPEASAFLVREKPAYFGGFVEFNLMDQAIWTDLPEVAKTGAPKRPDMGGVENNAFWEVLVPAIAPLAVPVAHQAADRLGIARGEPIRILDVGGGSGIFSQIWLQLNQQARAVQLDWPNVNAIARRFAARSGVGDRFETRDGDFRTADLGSGIYDYVILGHIIHQESPRSAIELIRKSRRSLKPGGTLVIPEFVLEENRTGHPMAAMFSARMLVDTAEGAAYRKSDYEEWLKLAGFRDVRFENTPGPVTIIYAS